MYLARDILPFVMYCVNGKPRTLLFIEAVLCDPLWENFTFALRVVFGSWTDFWSKLISILCVSMDHQLTPRVGAASFRLSYGLLRLLERELFIIYLQNTERDAIKLYGALFLSR